MQYNHKNPNHSVKTKIKNEPYQAGYVGKFGSPNWHFLCSLQAFTSSFMLAVITAVCK